MTRRDFLERLHELVDDFEVELEDSDEDLDASVGVSILVTDFNVFVLGKLKSHVDEDGPDDIVDEEIDDDDN